MPRRTKAQIAADAAAKVAAAPQGIATQPASGPVTVAALTAEAGHKLWILEELRAQITRECKPLIEEELRLRKELFAELVIVPVSDAEGTHYIQLGNGYRLQLVQPLTRELDQAQFEETFTKLAEAGCDTQALSEAVLRWVPKLDSAAYRSMPAEHRAIFDFCVVVKPSTVSVKVIPPGEEPVEYVHGR